MILGEKLRRENNYMQEQLADTLGVSKQAVRKWESDAAYPETDKPIRISKLFHCTTDYLLLDPKEPAEEENVTSSSGNPLVLSSQVTKLLMVVLGLIAFALIFYFGGDIVDTVFNVGRKLGNAIGDAIWK